LLSQTIAPVVERSITIAAVSTGNLTVKDFAMEGDEQKLKDAAHQMVANLAGSLAKVAIKEPVRAAFIGAIVTQLLSQGLPEHQLPEKHIRDVVSDNLDLACQIVERVAMTLAVSQVDETLAAAYQSRQAHRMVSFTC
jgi:CCR4-NOT transcription complex subunit 1